MVLSFIYKNSNYKSLNQYSISLFSDLLLHRFAFLFLVKEGAHSSSSSCG